MSDKLVDVMGKLGEPETERYSYTFNADGVEATYPADPTANALTIKADVRSRFDFHLRHARPKVGAYAAIFRGDEPIGCWSLEMETGELVWEPAE
jgi:hypothetical protein